MDERMEWIKVEHALPDDEIAVLTFCQDTERLCLSYHADGAWFEYSSDEMMVAIVTHWMEVIEPEV